MEGFQLFVPFGPRLRCLLTAMAVFSSIIYPDITSISDTLIGLDKFFEVAAT